MPLSESKAVMTIGQEMVTDEQLKAVPLENKEKRATSDC